MRDICQYIADDLCIDVKFVIHVVEKAQCSFKCFYIEKRNGSKRKIYHPNKKTKLIQYWLIDNIFSKFPIHSSATAYKKGTSTLKNALLHRKNRYFVRIDLLNFFPSLKILDVAHLFHNNMPDITFIDEEHKRNNLISLIDKVCFFKDGSLPVGYPTSPIISNIVLYDIDTRISSSILDKDKFGDAVYTRYADDIIFSTNKRGACNHFFLFFKGLLEKINSPSLSINADKTHYSTSSGGSAIITGVKLCHDKHITLPKKYKDHVRLLLSLLQKGKISESEKNSLVGHLNYLKYIDGKYYTKLCIKYFDTINSLIPSAKNLG